MALVINFARSFFLSGAIPPMPPSWIPISPKFLINHIIFIQQNGLDLATNDAISIINYIVDKKLYKKDDFVINNFQSYLEIFLMKMYSKTHDYRYYDSLLESVFENNLVNKFNLDLDSFFIKFRNKYLKI